jgi:hypothetical protein
MSWFKSTLIRSSLHAIFSTSAGSPGARTPEEGNEMDRIRLRMLALAALDGSERSALLSRRIRYATDLQALWFMRGELMALLAHVHGEAAARQKLESLSEMFRDLLPSSLLSRPSPLSSNYRRRAED